MSRGAMPPMAPPPAGAGPVINQLMGGPVSRSAPRPTAPRPIPAPPPQATPQAEAERLAELRNVFGDLLQKPKITTRDIVHAVAGAVERGTLSPGEATQELGAMPRKPDDIANRVADHYLAVSHAHAAVHHAVYGNPEQANPADASAAMGG